MFEECFWSVPWENVFPSFFRLENVIIKKRRREIKNNEEEDSENLKSKVKRSELFSFFPTPTTTTITKVVMWNDIEAGPNYNVHHEVKRLNRLKRSLLLCQSFKIAINSDSFCIICQINLFFPVFSNNNKSYSILFNFLSLGPTSCLITIQSSFEWKAIRVLTFDNIKKFNLLKDKNLVHFPNIW